MNKFEKIEKEPSYTDTEQVVLETLSNLKKVLENPQNKDLFLNAGSDYGSFISCMEKLEKEEAYMVDKEDFQKAVADIKKGILKTELVTTEDFRKALTSAEMIENTIDLVARKRL